MSARARRLPSGVAIAPYPWQRGTTGLPATSAPASPVIERTSEHTIIAADAAPAVPAADVAAIERDAFMKGYAQGERSGEEVAAQRSEAMLRRLVATLEEISRLRAGLMHRAERDLVRLALAIAERIVRREVTIDRELLMTMAHVAIDRLGEGVTATIRLNPTDHAAVLAARRGEPFGGAVDVVSDPLVSRGGCLVRTEFGGIDSGIDAQVSELSRALLVDETQEDPQHALAGGR